MFKEKNYLKKILCFEPELHSCGPEIMKVVIFFIFLFFFALQFTRKPSRRLSSRSHQPQSSTENQNQDIIDGFDPAAIRSPVVLSSLANGSLKRHSSSNGQK